MKKLYPDELVAGGLLCISFYGLYLTREFSSISARFPKFVLITIIILCLISIFMERLKDHLRSKEYKRTNRILKKDSFTGEHAVIVLVSFIYVILISYIGYYLASFFYLAFATFYLGFRRWKSILTTSFLFVILIFLFFQFLLGLRLPKGVIF